MITKISNPNYNDPDHIVRTDAEKLKEAVDLLSNTFYWELTAEGYEFWNDVVSRLNAIANGEPLR